MKKLTMPLSAACMLAAAIGIADSLVIDFEAYSPGSINGQDGWVSQGSAGAGCAVYDHGVSSAGGTSGFGAQSLRISNAVTSGCFGDQTFARPLTEEVGEPTAWVDAPTAVRHPSFQAQFSFASATAAYQPGLSVVVSPDKGDGSRMSWLQLSDTATGLVVNFYDYQDLAPYGSPTAPGDGVGPEDDFGFTEVAAGLDRAVPHTVKLVVDTVAGPRNDVVKVYVDGNLEHTGTSWEDYFRWNQGPGDSEETAPVRESRVIRTLLFRTAGAAAPATAGGGFLIDNVSLTSGPAVVGPPTSKDGCKDGGWANFNNPPFSNQGQCVSFVARRK